jgi:3,4-dihydroxy 2-butanone 4-phosphate synthase/GTP cyclohydrolase II
MVSADDINFMARYGRGLICLTLTQERCQQLKLPLMVGSTGDLHGTNFTVSIEAAEGVTTGISASDRATTIKAAVKTDASPNDIVQPGHIFPLMAQPGGVLVRAGHTEAGCDLARLAGHEPSAVIVEILNEDGTMARRPDLENFAKAHDLKIGTIEDLISYKIQNEKTVERVAESDFATEFGSFRLHAFQNSLDGGLHFALVHGSIDSDQPVLVRVHVENTLIDLLGSTHARGWPLRAALKQVAESDCGVVVVIRQPDEDNTMVDWMLRHPTSETETVEQKPDLRKDGVGAQILMDLGVRKMRLMSAPKVYHGLAGFNLEIVEYVTGDN